MKKSIFIIIVVGYIVFLNGIFNSFVKDDTQQIVNNPVIQSLSHIGTFFNGGTFYAGDSDKLAGVYYKPMINTVLSFIYTYFGPSPMAFHLFQISLHILNACLVFLFLTHFLKKPFSLLLSLIFLVHPINSEAAFYISALQENVYFFFGILSVWIITKSKINKYHYFVVPCLFLSLLSKETGVLFMVIACIYIKLFQKKYFYQLSGLLLVSFIFYLGLRWHAIGLLPKPAIVPIDFLSFPERLLNIPSIFFFYCKSFIFPLHLASSYQWAYTKIDLYHFVIPLIADLVFLGISGYIAVLLHQKSPKKYFGIYMFFCLWFFIGIFLILQMIPLDATAAERWFYFPIVGLLGMIGVALETFAVTLNQKWITIVVITCIVLLSVRTFVRSFDWRNQNVLDTHDIVISPDAYDLENGIGVMYLYQGKLDEAQRHIEKSIMLFPNFESYNNLGIVHFKQGRYQESKDAYIKSIQFSDSYQAYENLAIVGLVNGDPNSNLDFIHSSLKKYPQSIKLCTALALQEYLLNQTDEAKTSISKCYAVNQSSEMKNYIDIIENGKPLNLTVGIEK
jgi:protein O-mannosyl-transferase